MGRLQNGGVVEGFIATHPEAEGMADKDLFDAFAFGELPDHVDCVLYGAIEIGVARIDDLARGVDGLVKFGRPEQAGVVVHLKGEAEGVHLLMTGPAVFLSCDAHALAKGGLGLVRQPS